MENNEIRNEKELTVEDVINSIDGVDVKEIIEGFKLETPFFDGQFKEVFLISLDVKSVAAFKELHILTEAIYYVLGGPVVCKLIPCPKSDVESQNLALVTSKDLREFASEIWFLLEEFEEVWNSDLGFREQFETAVSECQLMMSMRESENDLEAQEQAAESCLPH